jgi:hypothetical protein
VDEKARLEALLEACHDVLPHLTDASEAIAEKVRETCRAIEKRLEELRQASAQPGVAADEIELRLRRN